MPDLGIQGLLPPSSHPISDPSTLAQVKDNRFHEHVLSPGMAKGSWDSSDHSQDRESEAKTRRNTCDWSCHKGLKETVYQGHVLGVLGVIFSTRDINQVSKDKMLATTVKIWRSHSKCSGPGMSFRSESRWPEQAKGTGQRWADAVWAEPLG